jgi:predicted Fe-S protein YdhL (DUF1289 family)
MLADNRYAAVNETLNRDLCDPVTFIRAFTQMNAYSLDCVECYTILIPYLELWGNINPAVLMAFYNHHNIDEVLELFLYLACVRYTDENGTYREMTAHDKRAVLQTYRDYAYFVSIGNAHTKLLRSRGKRGSRGTKGKKHPLQP